MNNRFVLTTALCAMALVLVGCKEKEPPAPAKPSVAPLARAPGDQPAAPSAGQLPPGHPPTSQAAAPQKPAGDLPEGHPPIGLPDGHPPVGQNAAAGEAAPGGPIEAPTQFDGIALTPPDGWQAMKPTASGSAMSFTPNAVFVLPKVEGDAEDGEARLTHFPGMKNIPAEANLNRWYAQFTQPSGKPTSEVAVTQSFVVEGVTVTLADMSGTMVTGMGGGGESKPNYRMLAAIIDHPQGPHFLTVKGPAATMERWRESVVEYLKSVKITP
jgi:hypothetical protein